MVVVLFFALWFASSFFFFFPIGVKKASFQRSIGALRSSLPMALLALIAAIWIPNAAGSVSPATENNALITEKKNSELGGVCRVQFN